MTSRIIETHGTLVPNALERLSGGAIEEGSHLVKIGDDPAYYMNELGWTPDTMDARLYPKSEAHERAESTRERTGTFRKASFKTARIVVAINR